MHVRKVNGVYCGVTESGAVFKTEHFYTFCVRLLCELESTEVDTREESGGEATDKGPIKSDV